MAIFCAHNNDNDMTDCRAITQLTSEKFLTVIAYAFFAHVYTLNYIIEISFNGVKHHLQILMWAGNGK